MSETRLVKCRKLGKELPGLTRQPYKNELGKRLYEEVSQEAWNMWLKDSVKFINTARTFSTGMPVDSASSSGVGSRPYSWSRERLMRVSFWRLSYMCTGTRMVRPWSAMAREID